MNQRFEMTTGVVVKLLTALSALILLVLLPAQLYLVFHVVPVAGFRFLIGGVLLLTVAALTLTFLWAPRAVRLEGAHLKVERLAWSDFSVPLRELLSVEQGPALHLVTGEVRRIAGNGGLMGFTGLFHVRNVGLVRCWATQLDRPTVLVHRLNGRPLLLGVDDAQGLITALQRRGVRA